MTTHAPDPGHDVARHDVRRHVDLLRALVEVESPSGDPDGLARVMTLASGMVEEATGRTPEWIDLDGGVPALRLEAPARPSVVLLCHLDTVWPRGTLATFPFAVDPASGRVTGPGTYDMKAGFVVALEVLRSHAVRDHVTLLVTADEEVGSGASRRRIEETAAGAAAVLVLEGSGPGGAVKHARKGVGFYELGITGRASHAGTSPELGVNATVELAHLVLDVVALADPGHGTTVTPTAAHSGTTTNTIPAAATLAIDVRSWRAAELARVDAAIHARAAALEGAVVEVRGGPNRPPLEVEHSASLLALAREVAADAGLGAVEAAAVGGGSDGNFTAALGVPTLDGLGAVGGNGHAPGEWIEVASIGSRATLVAGLVARIAAGARIA